MLIGEGRWVGACVVYAKVKMWKRGVVTADPSPLYTFAATHFTVSLLNGLYCYINGQISWIEAGNMRSKHWEHLLLKT